MRILKSENPEIIELRALSGSESKLFTYTGMRVYN